MTATVEILSRCRALGITIHVSGDSLRARGPAEQVKALLPAIREHKPEILRALTGTLVDLDAIAQDIGAEFLVPIADVLLLLDDDDRQGIRTNSDPRRAAAWRASVQALVAQGRWKSSPQNSGDLHRCIDCRHYGAGGRCLAAWRGQLPGVSKQYSPARPEWPHRCEAFAATEFQTESKPKQTDVTTQRT